MGFMFTQGATKKDVIKAITAPYTSANSLRVVTLLQCLRGNVLWTVHETTLGERWIGCYLLGAERGFGWGYKGMDESMHPYYYTCPLSYLEMAPPTCKEWREGVRDRAFKKRQARTNSRKVAAAPRLTLMESIGIFTSGK